MLADAPPELPPLRDVIRRFEIAAKRSLGQHFLLDLNLCARIARAAGDLSAVNVIEIGPGPGGLTRALLAAGARSVTAIERDVRCVAALAELAAAYPGRLAIVEANALTIDTAALVPPPRRLVANLPYNIATPLLLGWLARIDAFERLTLMFQKEVAERLAARPGSKKYGRLSVITQWLAEVAIEFNVAARAFTPPSPPPAPQDAAIEPEAARPGFAGARHRADGASGKSQRRGVLRAGPRLRGKSRRPLTPVAALSCRRRGRARNRRGPPDGPASIARRRGSPAPAGRSPQRPR